MVDHGPCCGTHLDGLDPFVFRQVDGDHEEAIEVASARRNAEGLSHLDHQVGLAEGPAAWVLLRLGHFGEVALPLSGLDPLGEQRDLVVAEAAVPAEVIILVSWMPWRHVPHVDDGLQHLGTLGHVRIAHERERPWAVRPVAVHATRVDERADVLGEVRAGGNRGRLADDGRGEQEQG